MTAPDELIKILERILDGSRDESDIALLRQSLQTDAQNQVQLAKNIVNIAEGRDIHIGDRITNQVIDEETKAILRDFKQALFEVNGKKSPSSTTENPNTAASLTQQFTSVPSPKLTNFEFEVVTVDSQGKEIKRCYEQAKYFTENLDNETLLEMVSISRGNFSMGASIDEEASDENERPQHLVTIQPFFIGKYPITQKQWKFVANLPKIKRELKFEPSYFKGNNLPVERVSWYDAQEFCERLSHKTGRIYRLPSEAQWEYACRARNSTPFHFGKTITTELANYCGQKEQTTEVGSFPPNNFGLYDMHGNLWEWCADCEHEDYYDAPNDGSVWIDDGSEEYRILRGGSWDCSANLCRSAFRFSGNPTVPKKEFGFRVACF